MSTATSDPGDLARQLIAALWERSVPLISERLAVLDRAAEASINDAMVPSLRHSAADTAHKLAGSLGMFGYPRGTEIARDLEQILDSDGPIDPIALRHLVLALRASLPL